MPQFLKYNFDFQYLFILYVNKFKGIFKHIFHKFLYLFFYTFFLSILGLRVYNIGVEKT